MSNLIVTIDVVLPVFMVMAIGWLCRRTGMVSAENISAMNKLVFKIFLPASLCKNLMSVESGGLANPSVLAFGSLATAALFFLGFLIIPRLEKENARRGVMIQGFFRSNFAIFGVPLSEALFLQGDGGVTAMMVIATIPLFNALSVVALESFRGGRPNIRKILIGIAKNPLIWGCIVGYVIMQLQIQLPSFAVSTISKLAAIASPLALFVVGGSIKLKTLGGNVRSLAISVGGKLIAAPALVLLAAYAMGFRGVEFAVLMIVFGAPCAVNSYTMAAQMDGDAELAAQQVMISTVLSSLTLSCMIFLFKTLGIF